MSVYNISQPKVLTKPIFQNFHRNEILAHGLGLGVVAKHLCDDNTSI